MIDGVEFTVTIVVPAKLVHPLTVDVTEYVPVAAVVAELIVGSSELEVKLFGPVQAIVPVAFELRFKSLPVQIGELLPAVGVAGIGFIVIAIVLLFAVEDVTHPPVTVKTQVISSLSDKLEVV